MILEARGGVATQPTEDAPLEHPAGLGPQQGTALPSLNELQGYVISWSSPTPWNLPQLGVQGPRPRGKPQLEHRVRSHLAARQPQLQGRLPDAADLAPAEEPVRRADLHLGPHARRRGRRQHGRLAGGRPVGIRQPDPRLRPRPRLHRLPHLDPVRLRPGPVGHQAEPDADLRRALRLHHPCHRRQRDDAERSRLPDRPVAAGAAGDAGGMFHGRRQAALPAEAPQRDSLQPVHRGDRQVQLRTEPDQGQHRAETGPRLADQPEDRAAHRLFADVGLHGLSKPVRPASVRDVGLAPGLRFRHGHDQHDRRRPPAARELLVAGHRRAP